jgi:hypothetical protein
MAIMRRACHPHKPPKAQKILKKVLDILGVLDYTCGVRVIKIKKVE